MPDQLPNSLSDLSLRHFPLFVSLDQFLKMLDGSLHKPFFRRNANGDIINKKAGVGLAWEQQQDDDDDDDGGKKQRSK